MSVMWWFLTKLHPVRVEKRSASWLPKGIAISNELRVRTLNHTMLSMGRECNETSCNVPRSLGRFIHTRFDAGSSSELWVSDPSAEDEDELSTWSANWGSEPVSGWAITSHSQRSLKNQRISIHEMATLSSKLPSLPRQVPEEVSGPPDAGG